MSTSASTPGPSPAGPHPRVPAARLQHLLTGHPRLVGPGILVLAVALGLALSLSLGPKNTLGDARTGDPRLIADVEAVIGNPGGLAALSAGRLSDGRITYAGLGEVDGAAPTPQTIYQLGSITKTFTGMLLADAVRRKEVQLSDPVAAYLNELGSTGAGTSTLQQLASHTSGLPPFPPPALTGSPSCS